MAAQDCLYTVVSKGEAGNNAHIVGAMTNYHYAPDDASAVLSKLCSPETRVVSLTVTEKGYCFDEVAGQLDLAHPMIAHDLEHPDAPKSAVGYIVRSLARRR